MNERLDKAAIVAGLSSAGKGVLSHLEILETIDSTNSYLLTLAKQDQTSGLVCLAEEQTQGRGRQGKQWYSPRGSNIYCSVLWHFPRNQMDLSPLSLAVAVMLVQALQRYGMVDVFQLKWPNDIYVAGRKLAGILIETTPAADNRTAVVVGVGLNIQLPADHPYANTSIDLTSIIGNIVARNHVASLLIDALLLGLPQFVEKGFAPFYDSWATHDWLRGQTVMIRLPQGILEGTARGINQQGELIVRDAASVEHVFRCGEVSIGGLK